MPALNDSSQHNSKPTVAGKVGGNALSFILWIVHILCINRNIKDLILEMYDYTEGENTLETLNLWKVIMYKYKYKR